MRRNAAGVRLETMMLVRGSRALLATPVAPPCLARRLAAGAAAVMVTPVLPTASVFDPTVRGVVRQTLRFVASSTASLSAVLVVLLFMFYGSSWDPRRYYRNVKFSVADYDGDLVGSALVTAAGAPGLAPYSWLEFSTAASGEPLAAARASVLSGHVHGAFVALPGAGAALRIAARNTSAVAAAAVGCAFVYDDGRSGGTLATLLRDVSSALQAAASSAATYELLALASAEGLPAARLNWRVVASPVTCALMPLHPVSHPGLNSAAGIAFIDLWVIMLGVTTSTIGFFEAAWANSIRPDHGIGARIGNEAAVSLCLSFWPPVVLLCLGGGITAATFFQLWAFIWLAMCTFGLCINALLRNLGLSLGNKLQSVFLILNLVSSGATTPGVLMPPFFARIGLALPFGNAVEGTRFILFGAPSEGGIGRNVGVLFAWSGLAIAVAVRAVFRIRGQLARHKGDCAVACHEAPVEESSLVPLGLAAAATDA